jgi:hypothetical protein
MVGGAQVLQSQIPTILKDNITWHFPMPGTNTTPWQLEGTILALRHAGYNDLVCVQNQTVVTNTFKDEDLNGYVTIFKQFRKKSIQGLWPSWMEPRRDQAPARAWCNPWSRTSSWLHPIKSPLMRLPPN